jgi:uracil-DNA glycosylase
VYPEARVRVSDATAEAWIPPGANLEAVRAAALGCRACPLWADATQAVFGEGSPQARWMLVGEIPGDQEDRQGHPFVGPAGRLLDACLTEAGLDRSAGWLTNVVNQTLQNR